LRSLALTIWQAFDTLLGLFLGRPDKWWSWAFVALLRLGSLTWIAVYQGDPWSAHVVDIWLLGEVLIAGVLVPLRKKWVQIRG
jgi:hypothetical protein